ncbi:hypothetical protein COO60DRAFT_609516 [Scenedesmus sp. NREL 46B-D3]|nr:hypothetical protein COO60DRAFT_609516 [Scenedesmus sp. NREL 46B-D3]
MICQYHDLLLAAAAAAACYFAAVPGAPGFDLLVAADVFVYIGELLPVLEAAATVAADRALFAFSTEMLPTPSEPCSSNNTCSSSENRGGVCQAAAAAAPAEGLSGAGYVLQATGRYAHSACYLRQAAAASGWQLVLLKEAVTLRYNEGLPILGNLCVLQRCA